MAKAAKQKPRRRLVPPVTQRFERAERAKLRGQVRHTREMRDLSRRLKSGIAHSDLALQGLVRDVAPRLGLTVVDRVQWERTLSHVRDLQDQLDEARRETRELREVREADAVS